MATKTKQTDLTKNLQTTIASIITEFVAQHPSREDELERALATAELTNQKLQDRLTAMNSDMAATRKEFDRTEMALRESIEKWEKLHTQDEQKIRGLDNAVTSLQESIKVYEQKIEALKAGKAVDDVKKVGAKVKKAAKFKDAIRHKCMDKVKWYIEQGKIPYLAGNAGTGKNVIAEMIADDFGLPFYMTNRVLEDYTLTGFVDANGNYDETPLYKACSGGGIFFFDEMDASNENALLLVNSLIANGYCNFPKYGLVRAHKDFHIIAAGNTAGTGADEIYTGRVKLDTATLDRFVYLKVNYDQRIELQMANGNEQFVKFVHDLRRAVKKCGVPFIVSYRGIKNFCDAESKWGIEDAMMENIIKGLDADNIEMIGNQLTNYDKYSMAWKGMAKQVRLAA